MPLSRRASPAALVWLLGGVLLAFFLYLIATVGRIETAVPNHDAVAVCIEKHKTTTGVTTVSVGDLYGLNGFCYDTIGSQLKIDQEKIRRDNFLFQRNENVVLLYMVVLITISGVVLAGVQLLASYNLPVPGPAAPRGRDAAAGQPPARPAAARPAARRRSAAERALGRAVDRKVAPPTGRSAIYPPR